MKLPIAKHNAGGVLYLIASGNADFDVAAGFASNGYGEHSPGGYSLTSVLITELVMTMMFLLIILGATDERASAGFAPIIGGVAGAAIYRMIGREENQVL